VETKLPMESADFKFEARNPKFETNPNVQNSKVSALFDVLQFINFEFVSDFDIRIPDFSIPHACLVPAIPNCWVRE
jgi:hypothetical protein